MQKVNYFSNIPTNYQTRNKTNISKKPSQKKPSQKKKQVFCFFFILLTQKDIQKQTKHNTKKKTRKYNRTK